MKLTGHLDGGGELEGVFEGGDEEEELVVGEGGGRPENQKY